MLLCSVPAGAALAAPPLYDVRDTVRKSFKVSPGATFSVDMDLGNVEVRPASGRMLVVEVIRIVGVDRREDAKEMLEQHQVDFDERGDDVLLRSRFSRDRSFWDKWRGRTEFKVQVVVELPEGSHLDFKTGAGNVEVTGVEGNVTGKTGAGNITLRTIEGDVSVASGSGNILISGVRGRSDVRTGAGNVQLEGALGALSVSTGAGNVEAEIARQPSGESVLESGAGNVTVYLAPRVGVRVNAVAALGSVSTDYPLKVEGKWMRQSFAGAVNGGGPELRLRSGVGSVVLRKSR